MKRSLLILMLLGVVIVGTVSGFDLKIGPKLYMGSGWFSGSDWDDYLDYYEAKQELHFVFAGGGFFEIGFHPNFALQPEVYFGLGGASIKGDDWDLEASVSAPVFQIPILAKGRLPLEFGTLYALLGPVFWIFGDVTLKAKSDDYDIDETDEETPDNSFAVGIALGGGVDFNLGQGALSVEIRYMNQLTEIFDNMNYKFNSLGLAVGYGFKLQ